MYKRLCAFVSLQLPFIAMYRKERCLDLLQEPEDQYGDSNGDGRPKLIRYEVGVLLSIGILVVAEVISPYL